MRFLFYGNYDIQHAEFGWPFVPQRGWDLWSAQLKRLQISQKQLWLCSGGPHDFFGLVEVPDVRRVVALEAWYRKLGGTGRIVFQPCHTRGEVMKIVRGRDAMANFTDLDYDEYPFKNLQYPFVFCGKFDPQYKDYDWGFHVLEANKRCEKKCMELGIALEGIWLCTGGEFNYFGIIHSPSIEAMLDWEQWYERMPGSGDIIFQLAFKRDDVERTVAEFA